MMSKKHGYAPNLTLAQLLKAGVEKERRRIERISKKVAARERRKAKGRENQE